MGIKADWRALFILVVKEGDLIRVTGETAELLDVPQGIYIAESDAIQTSSEAIRIYLRNAANKERKYTVTVYGGTVIGYYGEVPA